MVSPRKENSWMVDILLKILGVPQQFPMVKRSSFLSNDLGDLGSDLLLWLKSVLKISGLLIETSERQMSEWRQAGKVHMMRGYRSSYLKTHSLPGWQCCIRLLLGRLLPHRKCLLSCGWIVFGFDFFLSYPPFPVMVFPSSHTTWILNQHSERYTGNPRSAASKIRPFLLNLSLNQWFKQVDCVGPILLFGPELKKQRPWHVAQIGKGLSGVTSDSSLQSSAIGQRISSTFLQILNWSKI